MSRSRVVRPEFFSDGDLLELPPITRLLFIGLWTMADREGRLKDRPRTIKNMIFPSDECDVNAMLDALEAVGSIRRYVVEGERCIDIPGFVKHQRPHPHEATSDLPEFRATRHKNVANSRDAVTSQNVPLHVRTCRDKGTPLEQEQEIEQALRDEEQSNVTGNGKGPGFSEFWAAYPNKQGKAVAEKKWAGLSVGDRYAALHVAGLMREAVTAGVREVGFCPHGSTFIHQRRWEDWSDGPPEGYGSGNGKPTAVKPPEDAPEGYRYVQTTNPWSEELEWSLKREGTA